MFGAHQHVADAAGLDDLTRVHDRDVVAEVGDHAEVVRHEDDRHPALGDQAAQQAEDLGLDGDVQRGRGLVGDQQSRGSRQREGDRDTLRHAARDLVRVALQHARRVDDADVVEELSRDALGLAELTFRSRLIAAPSCQPMVNIGSSARLGSCEMNAIS